MKLDKTYIIAEVGPNHQGSLNLAKKYIQKLSLIGVDAIKFQIGIADEIYSRDAFKPKYQQNKKNKSIDIVTLAKKRLLKPDHLRLLSNECKKNKVDFICSAFDLQSLKFLFKYTKFPFFKIASGEIHSIDTLSFISKKKKPILLSTGMSDLSDIKKSLNILNKFHKQDIIILHCVSNYPTKIQNLNLNFIHTLRKNFKYPVGFSDHSLDLLPSLLAVSMGAKVIEKHVSLNKKWAGPDHKASLDINQFKKLVKLIRKTEDILGKEKKIITQEEKLNSRASKKSCVTNIDLNAGDRILEKNISFKRPGTGVSPLEIKKIINKKVKNLVKKNSIIKLSSLL
jgi:N,N'-diacetyllegionaminate synthase